MPSPKPGTRADWDTTLANLLMPPGGQIASGWANSQVVPSNWLNWWMNLVGTWTDYLNDFETHALTWTAVQTFTQIAQFQLGLDAGNHKITTVATPTAAQDAANKSYVDAETTRATGAEATLQGEIDTINTFDSKIKSTFGFNSVGPLPLSAGFTSNGGDILIFASGSGFNGAPPANISFKVDIDGGAPFAVTGHVDDANHHAIPSGFTRFTGIAAGAHTANFTTNTGSNDANDVFWCLIVELPA